MIIIYDVLEKTLNSRNISIETDPVTHKKANVELLVLQRYLSIFGPFATFGRQEVIAINSDLQQEIPKKEWPAPLKAAAQQLKDETPFAWGLFRNVYIVAGVFAALTVITPMLNKNRAARATEDAGAIEARFATTAAGDLLKVALLGNADGSGQHGVTLMKVVRKNADTLVVKRHKEVSEGFDIEATNSLDRNDAAFSNEEEKYAANSFTQSKILVPFPDESGKSPMAHATARDIEKAK